MAELQEGDQASSIVAHFDRLLRAEVEAYSAKAGETLDSFIRTASAELLRRRKEEEWLRSTRDLSSEGRAAALALLMQGGDNPPLPGDEIPEGYVRWEEKRELR